MNRTLRDVERLPEAAANALLAKIDDTSDLDDDGEAEELPAAAPPRLVAE